MYMCTLQENYKEGRIQMKKYGRLAAIVAIGALSLGAITGCGASLDREVSVQDMILEVPADWLEIIEPGSNDARGTLRFTEEDEDRDEDETGNVIEASYYRLSGEAAQSETAEGTETTKEPQETPQASQTAPSDAGEGDSGETVIDDESIGKTADIATVPRTAAEAIAAKQASLEKEQGVIAWSIDDEKTQVIDGAQVTSYEYSFVKEIEEERRKYEYKTVYVVTPAVMYEISVVGDAVSAEALIDTIEL